MISRLGIVSLSYFLLYGVLFLEDSITTFPRDDGDDTAFSLYQVGFDEGKFRAIGLLQLPGSYRYRP